MAIAATIWVGQVVWGINLLILLVTLALSLAAFIHCLTQRADAFPAIGTLSKPAWLGLIGVSLILSLLFRAGSVGLFALIAAGVALVYLLDVRPALRDASDGRGPW
jgi:hypothetical protein